MSEKKQNPVTLTTPEARARAERLMLEDIWRAGYQFARENPDYGNDEEMEAKKDAAIEQEVDGFLEMRPQILSKK